MNGNGNIFSLRRETHSKLLKIKRLEYILNTDIFEYFWDNLLKKEIKEYNYVKTLILFCDPDSLQAWLEKKLGLDQLSIDKLKLKARSLKIYNWSRLTKAELIFRIKKHEEKISKEKDSISNSTK